MTRKDLAKIIKKQIPLTRAMKLKVIQCSVAKGVRFSLPLKPNRNHKNTAFGGSLVAAQALASWAWLMAVLDEYNVKAEVVVQRQSSEFMHPVIGDFIIHTKTINKKDIQKFVRTLERFGKARILICAQVFERGHLDAHYSGEYVAIKYD